MELHQWFDKYEKKLKGNPLETTFVTEVFFPEFGNEGLDKLVPQFHLYDENNDEDYLYDFLFETENNNWIFETDGLYYHTSGNVSKEYFDRLQNKQNFITNGDDYRLIRYTSSILDGPSKRKDARYEIRRALISDEDAFKHWYAVREGYQPNEIQEKTLTILNNKRENAINKGLVIYPTGLGKTYLSAFDVMNFEPNKVLFILHINDLLNQALMDFQDILTSSDNPDNFETDFGKFFGGNRQSEKKYLFASIQSLSLDKNLKEFSPEEFDYIILDESHHSAAKTYQKVIKYFQPKFFLGLTATPERHDKKEILHFYNNEIFHEVTREEAYKKGFLVGSQYFGFTDNIDYENIKFNGFKYDVNDLNKALMVEKRDELIYEKYMEHAPDKKAIGFCVSILHAERMTKIFNEKGISSIAIHSKSEKDKDQEETIIQKFKKGSHQVAFVVDMVNEGISINDIECLMFLRPTESKVIFEQQYGRGLRIASKKEKVIVLDFIGNHRTADFIKSYFKIEDISSGSTKFEESPIDEKMVYYYDNNGNEIHFEKDAIKNIERLEIEKKNKPIIENIKDEWLEYGEYIEDAALEINNLYIKMGRHQRKVENHKIALKIINENPDAFELSSETFEVKDKLFKEMLIDKGVKEMKSGFRSLFIPKILGLHPKENGTKTLPDVGKKFVSDISDIETQTIVAQQLEKFLYWTDISGKHNKYVPGDKQFHIFGIYPYLFLELVLSELKMLDEGYNYITEDEIEFFIKFSRNMDEYKKISQMIQEYRTENKARDLELFLREKNLSSDSRFFEVIKEMKPRYTNATGNKIMFEDKFYEEKSEEFEFVKNLIKTEELILFEKDAEAYKNMLYSEYSIFDFHKNYLASS